MHVVFQCELVVLSKEEFNSVLKNEVSPEVKEKMEILKCIKVLRGISDHSIQRLAKLLIPRTFAKNRVIAFQGEEAMEMYFMKSGECRVVMEVDKEPQYALRPLPQAALKSCRLPSLSKKAQLSGYAGRSSVTKKGFDLRYITESRFPQQIGTLQSKFASGSRNCLRHDVFSSLERPSPQFSECYSNSDDGTHSAYLLQHERKHENAPSGLSFASMAMGSDFESRASMKQQGHFRQTPQPLERMRNLDSSYTLKSFLKDFERRDSGADHIPDLGFSDKHALSWNTGTNLTGMLRGDIGDAASYQVKFGNWARRVLARERKLCPEAVTGQDFSSAIPRNMVWNLWPPRTKKSSTFEDTVFLDVGALHTGDFFGEIGLLHHSRRKASILTVTSVEVLVLSKWDFNRQVDRDIVECLSANDYKKIDYILQQHQKTCRWALYKKKVMHEVLAARRQRFPNLYEHDMCRGMHCTKFQKRE